MRAQSKPSATIWVCGRTRDPYFVILGASLLFESWLVAIGPLAVRGWFPKFPQVMILTPKELCGVVHYPCTYQP